MYNIDNTVHLNVDEIFDEALRVTRVEMTTVERNKFIAKYYKTMQMRIDLNGNLLLEFKPYH